MNLGRFRSSALAVGLAGMLGVLTALPGQAATTVTVTPTTPSWGHYEQSTATASFVNGPGSPPAGSGSYQMATGPGGAPGPHAPPRTGNHNGGGKAWLSTNSHNGTKLSDITSLSYSTYVDPSSSAASNLTIALQLQIDLDGTGGRDTTMVFEPVYSPGQGAVVKGQWQTWNTVAGNWWFTTATSFGAPQTVFPSFAAIQAAYPNAKIIEWFALPEGAGLQFVGGQNSAGAPWSNFKGAVDNLTIATGSNQTTYDFELYKVAGDKDECKDGGWQNVRRADGSTFQNQGDCVSHTNNGR